MFDTRKVASKIRELRIQNNMTQMGLADIMGISVQAVSNWERGNSMPDISKLGELAELFHCSIDELLGESRNAQVLTRILEEEDNQTAADIELEDVKAVAPLLKPDQMEHILDACVQKQESISLEDLIPLAPFLSESYLEELLSKVEGDGDFDSLISLIPFLSGETVEGIAGRLMEQEEPKMDQVTAMAPFLSREFLDNMILGMDREANFDDIMGLLPFTSKEIVEKLAREALERGKPGMGQVMAMAPFLSREFLDQIILGMDMEANFDDIMGLIPFISKDVVEKLAGEALERGKPGMGQVTAMAPFLSRKFLGNLVMDILEHGEETDSAQVAGLAPFLDRETLRAIVELIMEKGWFSSLASIAPFVR